jgi:hypothetical protein
MIRKTLIAALPPRVYCALKRLKYRLTHNREFNLLQQKRRVVTADNYSYRPFDEMKCIFVHIPRCGGVSINKALFGNLVGGHTSLEQYLYIFEPKAIASYFKFTIVRNPWDRLVSAFYFLKKGGFNDSNKKWAEENLGHFEDFGSFVKQWVNKENIWKYGHFKPQYYYITDPGNKIKLDYIAFFENIDDDFSYITKRIGKICKLGHENITQRKDYQCYYNDETRQIVSEAYAKDIELLSYNFDNSSLKSQLARRYRDGGIYKSEK